MSGLGYPGGSPPSTVQMKQDLFKQRSAINDVQQQLDVDAFAGSMETPLVGGATAAGRRAGVAFAGVPETPGMEPSAANGQLFQDILMYNNPVLTGLAAAAGVLLLGGAWFALRGSHGLTLLTALSYVLLADLAINFFRSLVSKRWQESGGWAGSDAAAALAERAAAGGGALAERAAAGVAALARLHDRFLLCREPVLALKVGISLWALAVLGAHLSAWSLAALAFVGAFTLPAGYARHSEAIHGTYAKASRAVSQRWDALGLSRKQKALALFILMAFLFVRSAWVTRCVALLVGALAVRCHLKPAEVERIMAVAEPYTMSVKKHVSRYSVAASEFAMRSVGGKSHAR